eukprot:scaffold3380_cov106-Cylindrotheca_fusiformis.AAC.2
MSHISCPNKKDVIVSRSKRIFPTSFLYRVRKECFSAENFFAKSSFLYNSCYDDKKLIQMGTRKGEKPESKIGMEQC